MSSGGGAALLSMCHLITIFMVVANPVGAKAQDLVDQEWLLNPNLSNVYMQTVKGNALFETHQFRTVEGGIKPTGEANVKIELASLDTGNDLRDVRMRFLLFEIFKYPHAEISARIDKARLHSLETNTRLAYPLKMRISMHGIEQEMTTPVWVTRISDTSVSVATIMPIIVTAESFGLTKNVARLVEVIGGTAIAPAASITFDLMFGTGSLKPTLETERAAREKSRTAAAASAISPEHCETRLSVISQTPAIYFRTGSAELQQESRPLLDSLADIANRCPSVFINVEGHTDTIGSKSANQRLSELRARSVVEFLTGRGVRAGRIQWVGLGDTQPVAPNDTEDNRAKNRRIEFKARKR
jgi:OOP family OmpA-OmpF porin